MHVRPCTPEDVPQICEIYNRYVLESTITFEEQPLELPDMAARVRACTQRYPWYVCANDVGAILGYAYASQWKERAAYRHTAEVTVYVRAGQTGQGVGSALYAALLPALQALDVHVMLACIALPNKPSVALHERLGFRKVAHFNEVGCKFEQWLDVGYWQRVSRHTGPPDMPA